MEYSFFKNVKGQISIEFILILVVMLVYIQTVVQPVLGDAFKHTDDVSRLGQINSSLEKLVNSIDFISLSPSNSEQEIRLFLPANSLLKCTSSREISFELNLNSPAQGTFCAQDGDSSDSKCTKKMKTVNATSLDCSKLSGSSTEISTSPENGKLVKLKIRKSGATTHVEEV